MIETQFINYILDKRNYNIVVLNNIDNTYFAKYKDEFDFINDHYNQYKVVPDKATFVNKFPDFVFTEVNETEKYLIQALDEERTYNRMVPILNNTVSKAKTDSRTAVEYLLNEVSNLSKNTGFEAIDLVKSADKRLEEYLERTKHTSKYYVTTGFQELDEIIGGWDRKEEYGVVTARTGKGKSFLISYFALHCAKLGLRVGIYSGEMSDTKLGFRIDTLFSHISNYSIMKGDKSVEEDYRKSIDKFKNIEGNIFVCTPQMLGGFATVGKLKAFVEKYNLDILFIDQISLMEDMRGNRIRFEKFESISKDIKNLQVESQIPIIVAAQLGRGMERDEDPDTTNIALSDRIAQDATLIISMQRKENTVVLQIMKSRDGGSGNKLYYNWDVDKGIFQWIPAENDALQGKSRTTRCEKVEEEYTRQDSGDPF